MELVEGLEEPTRRPASEERLRGFMDVGDLGAQSDVTTSLATDSKNDLPLCSGEGA